MEELHRQWVADATRGDAGAVGELLRHHFPGLLGFVRLRAGRELLAEESALDIVQSACREVLRGLSRFRVYRDELDFKRWLYATVERKIIDRARCLRSRPPTVRARPREGSDVSREEVEYLVNGYSGFYTPSRQAEAREELERVERAFRELPDDYREVIVQVRLLGRAHAEVAGEMGRTVGALRMLLSRAVARLARRARLA